MSTTWSAGPRPAGTGTMCSMHPRPCLQGQSMSVQTQEQQQRPDNKALQAGCSSQAICWTPQSLSAETRCPTSKRHVYELMFYDSLPHNVFVLNCSFYYGSKVFGHCLNLSLARKISKVAGVTLSAGERVSYT